MLLCNNGVTTKLFPGPKWQKRKKTRKRDTVIGKLSLLAPLEVVVRRGGETAARRRYHRWLPRRRFQASKSPQTVEGIRRERAAKPQPRRRPPNLLQLRTPSGVHPVVAAARSGKTMEYPVFGFSFFSGLPAPEIKNVVLLILYYSITIIIFSLTQKIFSKCKKYWKIDNCLYR